MAGRTMAEIWVAVRPDVAKTGAELSAKLGKVDVSKAGKKAGDSYSSGFGTSVKKIAGIAAGVVAGVKVKNFLLEATTGYRDHVKIANVTNQVIKTTGAAAKVSATQVGALADSIELKTGVDGDAIQSGENLLLTFTNVRNEVGKGNQIFNRASGLLADMSVALGQDAKGSAIQLGKALNDPITGVTALSKVGVSFTEQQKKQIKTLVESGNVLKAQKIILAELGKEFGGAAAAAADPADRATAAYHQLQDQIGSGTLPIVNALASSFADYLAPSLIDIAAKHGPAVTAFLAGLAPKISASLGLLITGDFNGKIGKALGGLAEDSPYVGGILAIRQGLTGVKDTLTALATGDFTGKIFGQGEDSRFVDVLFKVREGIAQLATSIKNADTTGLRDQFFSLVDSAGKLLPIVGEFIQKMPSLGDVVGGATSALAFLADHTDTLQKLLPFLVAGVIAYKAAQAAANIAALVAVPTKIAEVLVNKQLVKSNRELIASRAVLTAETIGETVATNANTGAKNVGILASIRQRVAAVASAVATRAIAIATGAWTAAQWLLNVALTANPIGLVIAAAALLAAGFVILWKRSSTFREVMTASFNAIRNVTITVIQVVWSTISGFFADLLTGAAKAFGWVPGLGPKLKAAAQWFGEFRDSVNKKLDGLKDHKINFEIKYSSTGVNLTTPSSVGRRASGGPGGQVNGPGTTTSDTAGIYALSRKEWVIKAKSSMKYGDYAMASVNAGTATIIPGLAGGGKADPMLAAFRALGYRKTEADWNSNSLEYLEILRDLTHRRGRPKGLGLLQRALRLHGYYKTEGDWDLGTIEMNEVLRDFIERRQYGDPLIWAAKALGYRVRPGESIHSRDFGKVLQAMLARKGAPRGIMDLRSAFRAHGYTVPDDTYMGSEFMNDMIRNTLAFIPGFASGGRPGLNLTKQFPDIAASAQSAIDKSARAAMVALAKSGGNLMPTRAWGESQAGKPYGWGASGPDAYDCSGFVGALVNRALGRPLYARVGATGSMPWPMMADGPGRFSIGWFAGNPGHTAATIDGENFESAGGVGVRYGRRARGAGNGLFRHIAHVKGFARGGRPGREGIDGDLPFDLPNIRNLRGRDFLKEIGVYDRGGKWPSGTLGVNLSGKTETVVPGDGTVRLHPEDIRALAKELGLTIGDGVFKLVQSSNGSYVLQMSNG